MAGNDTDMTRGNGRRSTMRISATGTLLALLAGVGAGAAAAQDTAAPGGFQLPPRPAAREERAGPVDADNPVVRPSTPPAATVAGPTPAPSIAVPPPSPRAQPTRRPRPERAVPATPAPTPAPIPGPIETAPAAPQPAPTLAPAPLPTPVATPATPKQGSWPWLALLGAVAALLAGLGLWRRFARRTAPDEATYAAPEPAAPAPEPASTPLPNPVPANAPPATAPMLDLQLEAREMTGSLVYATLSYRLTLTNRGPAATGPLAVAGDLVSAHASVDSRALLAPAAGDLAPLHEAPPLAPGESAELSGALRIPLAAILPLAGGAAFVPLARFHVESPASPGQTSGEAIAEARIFVIGPAGATPDDALRPFRFDQFPGVVRDLGQREIRATD